MIEVVHDKEPSWAPAERCAICTTPTRFWFASKDVPVCQECAKTVTENDVPNKQAWLQKQRGFYGLEDYEH